jgi:cell wall-associated NlpC family hydrolase
VTVASVAPVASAETQGQAIVADANQYLGDAYCWDGGTLTPSPGPTHGDGNGEEWYGGSAASGCNNSGPEASVKGFDCSGLAMVAVYEATGIALPHSAQDHRHDPRLGSATSWPHPDLPGCDHWQSRRHTGL